MARVAMRCSTYGIVQSSSGRYAEGSWHWSMAPPVRAGIINRHVVPTTASRRGARIERAIWG